MVIANQELMVVGFLAVVLLFLVLGLEGIFGALWVLVTEYTLLVVMIGVSITYYKFYMDPNRSQVADELITEYEVSGGAGIAVSQGQNPFNIHGPLAERKTLRKEKFFGNFFR